MTPALLPRLAAGLAATTARDRVVERVGPFQACLSPHSVDAIANVAIPVAPAEDWALWLGRLQARFDAGARPLRFEFFAELYPTLAAALEAFGMVRQMIAPVMALDESGLKTQPAQADIECVPLPTTDSPLLDACIAVQHRAFDMPSDWAGAAEWRARMATELATGQMLATLARVEGTPAAAGVLLRGGGVAELAGVGTVTEYRRRGLATALCHDLLRRYFAAGGELAWLSAGDMAEGLYRRLGFQPVGTQLNYGRPPPAS